VDKINGSLNASQALRTERGKGRRHDRGSIQSGPALPTRGPSPALLSSCPPSESKALPIRTSTSQIRLATVLCTRITRRSAAEVFSAVLSSRTVAFSLYRWYLVLRQRESEQLNKRERVREKDVESKHTRGHKRNDDDSCSFLFVSLRGIFLFCSPFVLQDTRPDVRSGRVSSRHQERPSRTVQQKKRAHRFSAPGVLFGFPIMGVFPPSVWLFQLGQMWKPDQTAALPYLQELRSVRSEAHFSMGFFFSFFLN